MSNARLSRQHTAKLAGLSAALLLALAGGCGGGDSEALKQIQKAEQTIGALTADGTFVSIADTYRRNQLVELGKSMEKLAGDGPDSVRAAALSIAARAKAGVASLDTKAAVESDQQLDSHLSDLKVGLNTFTLQKSIAENNTGAGTQGLIKILQASLDANKKSADDAHKAAARSQATVDELSTRVKAVSAQANAKRQEASSIAAGMQGVSATQGLEIIKRSAAVLAEADALEQQSSDIGTQLGLAQAELARARSLAASLDDQTKQIQGEIAGAQSHLSEEQKLADTAGKAADAAAGAIKTKYTEFNTFRSATLEPAHQAAVTSAQKAVELSKQATAKAGGNPGSVAAGNAGKLASASMQQNYADALVSQARAFDQMAGTFALLATSQPALPGAAEYAAAAEAARKSADDTLTQAREIYSAVRESLDGISDEKLKGRLGDTSKILEALSSKQGVKAPEATPAPAPTPSGTTPAPAGAVSSDADVAAVKKVLDQMHDKIRSGDVASITNDLSAFDDDAQRAAANSLAELQSVNAAFEKACQDKLGKSSTEVLGPIAAMMGGNADKIAADAEAVKNMTSADYTVTVSGDKATATDKGGTARELVKRDGKWLIAGGLFGANAPALPPQVLANVKTVLTGITADINSGKITTPEQVQTALMAKMGGMGRPRGGKPGGGGADDPNK